MVVTEEKTDNQKRYIRYPEDDFDLDAYKAAVRLVRLKKTRARKIRKWLGIYRLFIMILSLFITYWLYGLANDLILQYEHYKYHTPLVFTGQP